LERVGPVDGAAAGRVGVCGPAAGAGADPPFLFAVPRELSDEDQRALRAAGVFPGSAERGRRHVRLRGVEGHRGGIRRGHLPGIRRDVAAGGGEGGGSVAGAFGGQGLDEDRVSDFLQRQALLPKPKRGPIVRQRHIAVDAGRAELCAGLSCVGIHLRQLQAGAGGCARACISTAACWRRC
jgi:hypothetical protein